MPQRFSAVIFKVGINPCVDVPARISVALDRKGYIPVKGTLNGHAFKAGLVSLGNGRHRLYINGPMRKTAGVDTGDKVTVVLDYDPQPRRLPIPGKFKQSLGANPKAKRAWDDLTATRRKEILSYLNHLKQPESLERNIARTMKHLLSPESGASMWRQKK
ncbi:MAG TPA: YdeI/OmpD-associated family protein [Anaerolineales bacterium]|jgi:hypothetical protein